MRLFLKCERTPFLSHQRMFCDFSEGSSLTGRLIRKKKVTWPVDDPSKVQLGRLSALLPAASTFFLSSVLVFERDLPAASILINQKIL